MKKEEIIEIYDRYPDSEERSQYLRAKRRVKKIKSVYIHITIYVIIASVHFIKTYIEQQSIRFEDSLGMILWGIAVLIHAGSVFLPTFFLGKNWEEEKIQKLTKQYKETK